MNNSAPASQAGAFPFLGDAMNILLSLIIAVLATPLFPVCVASGLMFVLAKKCSPNRERLPPVAGLVGGIVFIGYALGAFGGLLPCYDDGVGIVFRSLAIAGIAAAVVALILTVIDSVWQKITRRSRAFWAAVAQSGYERRYRRDERSRQRESERKRSEQDRIRQRQVKEQADTASAGRRREDARLRCEQFYVLHPEVQKLYPPEQFQQYINRYLGDERAAEDVERRANSFSNCFKRNSRRLESKRSPRRWASCRLSFRNRLPPSRRSRSTLKSRKR